MRSLPHLVRGRLSHLQPPLSFLWQLRSLGKTQRRRVQLRARHPGLRAHDPAPEPAPKQPAEPAPTPDPSQIAAPAAAAVASASASRKELLPDIEEINSSLRSDAERSEAGEMPDNQSGKKRKGFRGGFVTVLLIILAFVLVYIFADQIAAAIPALAGPLATYVETVDVWRIWLDDNVQAMLRSIAAE